MKKSTHNLANPFLRPPLEIVVGDCRRLMRKIPEETIDCVVTSPPYFGLRDYKAKGQIGLENTPEQFLKNMVAVFREVHRILKPGGTVWVNMGDSYAGSNARDPNIQPNGTLSRRGGGFAMKPPGYKPKDIMGMPWRLAFALQADGWYLRQDIVWAKPNPMPESVRDRCTKAHEYIFLLTKSPRYFYDADAIREPMSDAMLKQIVDGYEGQDTKLFEEHGAQSASGTKSRIIEGKRKKIPNEWDTSKGEGGHGSIHKEGRQKGTKYSDGGERGHERVHEGFRDRWEKMTKAEQQALGSNKRSVWTVATYACREAHFATFPPDLIKPCILAGCPVGGVVLDPFGGSGTTGLVAVELGRKAILLELNPDYAEIAKKRTHVTFGLPL